MHERNRPAEQEREERRLVPGRPYVSMTSAKERLCLVADEGPCEELEEARDRLPTGPEQGRRQHRRPRPTP